MHVLDEHILKHVRHKIDKVKPVHRNTLVVPKLINIPAQQKTYYTHSQNM